MLVIAGIFTVLIAMSGCTPLNTLDKSASSNLKDLHLSKPTKQKFVDAFGPNCSDGIDVSILKKAYTARGGSQSDDACEMLSNILDTYSLTIIEGQKRLPVETGTFRVGEAQSIIPSISLNSENSYSITLEFRWSKDSENTAIFGGQSNITSQEA